MTYTVHVAQFERPVLVEAGQTLLDAALAANLPYPHGCTAGNCGACKSELLAGEIDLLPHSAYALSSAEATAGKILACRTVPRSDCSVAILGDDELIVHAERHLTCRVAAREWAAHDVVRLRLEVLAGGPFAFSAGQYASLTFAGQPARDFSMANAPDDPMLEFHLRLIPGGRVSGYAATQARLGETLRVRGPFGAAYLREQHTGPVLLAGGGTGLAPMLSILATLGARSPTRDVVLYVGARDERDLYAQGRLAALAAAQPALRVVPVLSEPTQATAYRTGYLADTIVDDVGDPAGWKAYLAGPPVMVETVGAMLEAKGLPRRDLHADAFLPAPAEVMS